MANWSNKDAFRQQKKSKFVYKPAPHRSVESNVGGFPRSSSTCTVQRNLSQVGHASTGVLSPRKKMKSSYGITNKASEQAAAEELFRDLPPDVFDDDSADLGDEFEDELTAEQLCEAASMAELENWKTAESEKRNRESLMSDPDTYSDATFSENLSFDSKGDNTTKHNLDMLKVDKVSASSNFWTSNSKCTSNPESNNSRINTHTSSNQGTSVLFSAKSEDVTNLNHGCRNGALDESRMQTDCRGNGIQGNLCSDTRDCFSDSQLRALQMEIEKLRADNSNAHDVISTLEEEKYGKDGELKMLHDSLAHFQAEEVKKRDQIRAMEEQKKREQSDKEKELQKQVENLTTRLKFKEQEVTQIKEQRTKQPLLSNERASGSPQKKKKTSSADNIPTGSSFFERSSPESRKSPKVKNSHMAQKTSDVIANNSENSYSENSSKSVSGESTASDERAVTHGLKKGFMKTSICCKGAEVELLQKLFRPQNAELCKLHGEYEVKTDDESLLPLLKTNMTATQVENMPKKTDDLHIDIPPTLHLFETQLSKKTQPLSGSIDVKNELKPDELTLALESIHELLNTANSSPSKEFKLPKLSSNSDSLRIPNDDPLIPSALGFVPILESHISLYSELRMDPGDDSLTSTYSGNSQVDSTEQKEAVASLDREGAQILTDALNNAMKSLRCLNVLVLYSSDVQEVLLSSFRVQNEEEDGMETDNIKKKPAEKAPTNDEMPCYTTSALTKCDLISMLYKLLVKQPNEPSAVIHATLSVMASLAKDCPPTYHNRMFPLLSDGLLTQCLSRDWSPETLSFVIPILTSMASFTAVIQHLCSKTDECILLKVYQGCLTETEEVPHSCTIAIQLQIVEFIDALVANQNDMFSFLLDAECQCSMELIKCLVLMLYKEMKFIQQFPSVSLTSRVETRSSLDLLRQGMSLLATLCMNDRLLVEHRIEVEHHFVNLISNTAQIYNAIPDVISELEVLAIQDLSDLEHIEDIEWSQEYGDEEEIETMDIDG